MKSSPFSGVLFLAGAIIASMLFIQGVKVSFEPNADTLEIREDARLSTNIEDKRGDDPPIPDPTPTSSPLPVPVPTPNTQPNSTEYLTLSGIIQDTKQGYEGWNLRKCPSIERRCLSDYDYFLIKGDPVQLITDSQGRITRAYNNGIEWLMVRSPRLNTVGWIATNGVEIK